MPQSFEDFLKAPVFQSIAPLFNLGFIVVNGEQRPPSTAPHACLAPPAKTPGGNLCIHQKSTSFGVQDAPARQNLPPKANVSLFHTQE